MELVPYVVAYIAIGVFVVAVLARISMWLKLPIHVRWELYPVAHDAKRGHYGGSYLEETDWWTKPREESLWAELKVMVPEILLLVALREHNRKMWYSSFPFHFGLYLVIGATLLLLLNGALAAAAPQLLGSAGGELSGLGSLLANLILFCGVGGLALGLLGALGLLLRRLADPELRDFTAPADLFNLVFFILAFGTALASFLLVDPGLAQARTFAYNLVTFRMGALPGSGLQVILPAATVILLGLLVAYIPLTHMSHFVGKFFAYHAIRWNDRPNLRGGDQEEQIKQVLSYPVSWSAPHIKGDGKKNWVDVATEEQKK